MRLFELLRLGTVHLQSVQMRDQRRRLRLRKRERIGQVKSREECVLRGTNPDSDPLTEQKLSEAAIANLLRDRNALLAFLRRRGASDAEAEDVLQTASLRALSALQREASEGQSPLRSETQLRGWFFQILKNTHHDLHRGTKREIVNDDFLDHQAQEPSLDEQRLRGTSVGCGCAVTLMTSALSAETAALVAQVDHGDASVTEAAAALGLGVNAASVRLHRARATLRSALASTCGTCCATYRGAASCSC